MLNWLKRSLGAVLAVCMLVSMLPTALAADRSEIENHWAKEPLTYFIDQNWLQGCGDGTYQPNRIITRAEFMTLLNKACGFTEQDDAAAKKFTDVPEDAWYFANVSIALAAGYVSGTGNATMSPNAPITREQAFAMVARIAGAVSDDLTALDKFSDSKDASAYAKPYLAALTELGYVAGCGDGTVKPLANITRAEAVQVMYKALDLLTTRYVLMNIPYDQFYAEELKNDVAVDGVTSATKNKTRTQRMAAGSYHVNADGTDITGITFPVKVARGVDLSGYTKITDDSKVEISVTNRGSTSTTTYEGKDALFESASYSYYVLSEAPSYYKEATLDKDGKLTFGKIQGAEVQKLDVTASLTTKTSYGDYQVDVDMDDDTVDSLGTVYGIVFTTKEGNDYAMRHLENIWFGTEIAWCAGFTATVHGCPTSSDHYVAMMGQTINKITYITSTGIYTIDAELYVPVKAGTKLEVASILASAGQAEITEELPDDYQPLYTVTNAKGDEVEMEVDDGCLIWKKAAIGAYTLTVTDNAGKYAPVSASFVLSTEAMPAQAAEDNQSIVKTEDATEEELSAFIAAISKVNVNGKDYAAAGRGAAKVIKDDGSIDFTTAPFKESAVDGKYVLTITATGYAKTLTVTVPETYYLYASLTYEEYWANEGVYNAANTDSSDALDSHNEYDKGGFDAVARATTNHGLHRGSFQQDVVIHAADKDYYPLYWTDANNFVDREDGNTYNKSEIGIVNYEITGIKYVPVAVRAQDYAQFVKDYEVTLNGETMYGGYSEKALAAYEYTAEVTANTNGLKAAALTDGVWSFGPRQTGTDSGLQGQDLTVFSSDIAQGVKDYSGSFGEFLRYDITGDGFGSIGSAMQTVKWTYYGTDSTYTTPVAAYGTKFAADNWMHKMMGVQLGLTDSIRCQLPEGADGTGYWTVTIYGLGAADYTARFEVTADNLPKKVEPMTDEQKAQLTALKDEAGEILAAYDEETVKATPALAALKEHYDEAAAMLADAEATEEEAKELLGELPGLIETAKALTPAVETYTGTAVTKPDEDEDFTAYDITASVTVEGGKITAITAQGGGDDNAKYLGWALSGRSKSGRDYVGVPAQLIGKTVDEVSALSGIDAVAGATCSSTSILEAVQNALTNPAA